MERSRLPKKADMIYTGIAFVYQYGIVQFHRLDSRPNMSATRVQLGFNLSEPGPDLVLIWALQAQFASHVGCLGVLQ